MKLEKVTNNLWRGSRPDLEKDFQLVKNTGIKRVLNLEWGWDDWLTNTCGREASIFNQLDIGWYGIKMSDFTPPTKDQLDKALSIIAKEPTFVHCKSGVDRTGMVVAYYRVKIQGWTVDSAVNEMVDQGMHIWYQPFWIPALRKYTTL